MCRVFIASDAIWTRSEAGDSLDVISWSGETYRLIPSRFPPVAVYEALVPTERMEALVKVENLTNPRLRSLQRLAHNMNEDPATSARLQNWNLAPFAYGNPEGSTFFGEETPCVELCAEGQTALAVSIARRNTFLDRTDEPATGLDMRMLKTPVTGRFWDLRSQGVIPSLSECRRLGGLMPPDADGILFRPAERPSGTAVVVVNGGALEKAEQTVHYRYVWNGRKISQIYAFDKEGRKIEADTLGGEIDVLVA